MQAAAQTDSEEQKAETEISHLILAFTACKPAPAMRLFAGPFLLALSPLLASAVEEDGAWAHAELAKLHKVTMASMHPAVHTHDEM